MFLFFPSLKKINNKQAFINPHVDLCKRLFREKSGEQGVHSARVHYRWPGRDADFIQTHTEHSRVIIVQQGVNIYILTEKLRLGRPER